MWLLLAVTAHAAPACTGVDFTAAEACDTRACLTAALGAPCLASLDALEAPCRLQQLRPRLRPTDVRRRLAEVKCWP